MINFESNLFKIFKVVLIFIFIYFLLFTFGKYLLPFILGYILATILLPIYKFFEKLNFPKTLNAIFCVFIFICIVSFISVGIIGKAFEEGKIFFNNLPSYAQQVKTTFTNFNNNIFNFFQIFPDFISDILVNLYSDVSVFLSDFITNLLTNNSVKVIKKIPNFFFIMFISILSCFLIIIDKENIENFVLKQIPKNYLEKFIIIKKSLYNAVFGYIKAQFIIMCIVSIICLICYTFMKTPYSLFLSVLTGFIDALPFFGSGFILWPWSLYNVITGNYQLALYLLILYFIILITRQFLEPRIIGKQIGLHPLATLISIYLGIKLLGIFGFIIGPLILVVLKTLQKENILSSFK